MIFVKGLFIFGYFSL